MHGGSNRFQALVIYGRCHIKPMNIVVNTTRNTGPAYTFEWDNHLSIYNGQQNIVRFPSTV